MAHVDRVRRLLDLQGSHPAEPALLESEVVVYEPHSTQAAGINSTYYVELDGDLVAFHKPHDGIVPRTTRRTGGLACSITADDADLFGLAGILEPDRAERLRWRAQRMLDLGVVLLKGVV